MVPVCTFAEWQVWEEPTASGWWDWCYLVLCGFSFRPFWLAHTRRSPLTAKKKLRMILMKQHLTSALQPLTHTKSFGHLTAAPCVQVTMSRVTGSLKGTVESGRLWRVSCPTGTPTTRFHSRRDKLGPTSCNLHAVLSEVWKSSYHLMETGDFTLMFEILVWNPKILYKVW